MRTRGSTFPKVVACMPAWNAAAFIEPVLESLAAQTYPNLHVLISVDLGDDGTAELCAKFAQRYPNFEVLAQPTRLGWIENSNVLIRRAAGEYLFFAFHDDPLFPTYVSRLVEALERNPNAVNAFSDMLSAHGTEAYRELEGITDRFDRARKLLSPSGPWWCPNRGLVRADVAKEVGGLRRHLGGEFGADWPWLMSLALRGEFVRVAEPLLYKDRRPEGLNAKFIKSATIWKRLSVRLACLREIRRVRPPLLTSLHLHFRGLVCFVREERWLVQRKLPGRARLRGPR